MDILAFWADEVADYYDSTEFPLDEPGTIADVLKVLEKVGALDAVSRLRARVIGRWQEDIRDQMTENSILSSYFDAEDEEKAKEELETFVRGQLEDMGIEVSQQEAYEICETVDLNDVIADNIEMASREDDDSGGWRRGKGERVSDMTSVDDLFDRSNQ